MADIITTEDSELVRTIAELYSLYTGQEIADAHVIVRKRLNLVQEVAVKKRQIKQAQEDLAALEADNE